jgi:alpha-tubulin suppressor-like RCC1 family protein
VRTRIGAIALATLCACADTISPSHVSSVRFTAVSAGVDHTCALSSSGTSYCWGNNLTGAVGISSDSAVSPVPQPVVVGPLSFKSLDVGAHVSCGFLSSDTPLCWGDGESAPRELSLGSRLNDISLGHFSCGLRTDSVAICWDALSADAYPIEGTRFRQLSVGEFGCGLTSGGSPECWQRGDVVASPVPGGFSFTVISVGGQHACGLRADGELNCWGDNRSGQLGDFTLVSRDTPAPVASTQRFTALAAGTTHTCAIAQDGQAYCWGSALDGRLGYGGTPPTYGHYIAAPARVRGGDLPAAVQWRAIGAGDRHSCGVTAEGRVYCWGANQGGQLGDGTTQERSQPKLTGAADE